MIDIRVQALKERIRKIKKIVVVCSSKGGVGKSTAAYILSCILSKSKKIALCDFDFTGPSLHLLLDTNKTFTEENGIKLPEVSQNLFFLSIVFFTHDKPLALRGNNISNIILELFTIADFENIEILIIDTPPTTSDLILDILKYLENADFWVVSSNSLLSYHSVNNFVEVISQRTRNLELLILNKIFPDDPESFKIFEKLKSKFRRIISLPYINNIHGYYGKIKEVRSLDFIEQIEKDIVDFM
ncbi:MAG: P-loop NTPase [bacterium]|nr:P-loop NTPase [bacterium]